MQALQQSQPNNVAQFPIATTKPSDRLTHWEDYDRLFSEVLGNAKVGRSVVNAIFTGDMMTDYAAALLVRRSITDRSPSSLGLTDKQHRSLLAAIVLGTTIASTLERGHQSEPIDSPEMAAGLMMDAIGYQSVEYGAIVALDVKHHPIASRIFAIGDQSSCLMHPQPIFKFLLSIDAVSFFLYHNHPSGSIEQSPEDIQVTTQIYQASRMMGMNMLDHIILGCGRWRSIRECTSSIWG